MSRMCWEKFCQKFRVREKRVQKVKVRCFQEIRRSSSHWTFSIEIWTSTNNNLYWSLVFSFSLDFTSSYHIYIVFPEFSYNYVRLCSLLIQHLHTRLKIFLTLNYHRSNVLLSVANVRVVLSSRPRHVMATVEAIIQEASRVPLYLPNVSALKEALRKAREWSDKVDQVQVR